jgi:type II secretory pathway pseudopilin PulG
MQLLYTLPPADSFCFMKNNKQDLKIKQSGFSIIELLVILTVLFILTTIALFNFDRSKSQFQRQNIAREFKTYLERARFDSVKRRASSGTDMARVRLINANSFSVSTDFNQDGVLDVVNERRTVSFAHEGGGGSFVGVSNFPVDVFFDRHGHVLAVDNSGSPITPTFIFCTENCTASGGTVLANSQNATMVAVSSTGTVMIAPGGSSITPTVDPNVTNVNANTGINPLTRIPTTISY